MLAEKLPFFALSLAGAWVVYMTQSAAGAVQSTHDYPFPLRAENALNTWVVFLGKMFWPLPLAAINPYPKSIPLWQPVLAGMVIAVVSLLVLRFARRFEYAPVGWFWYVGTLVPVIGFVQAGFQSRTSHFMYVPLVGLAMILAWGAADFLRWAPSARLWVISLFAGCCVSAAVITSYQIGYWKDSLTLFSHAVQVTNDNFEAYQGLGFALTLIPGRLPEAIAAYRTEIRIRPDAPGGHTNLGVILMKLHRTAEATVELRQAIQLDPNYAQAHNSLAAVLMGMGLLVRGHQGI